MKSYDEFIQGLKEEIEVPRAVESKFNETLNHLPEYGKTGRRKKFRWPVTAAAAAAVVLTMSLGVYAAVKIYDYVITENKEKSTVDVEINKNTDDYIPPITITPGYLPEGYKEWSEGQYSYNGEWAAEGLTIQDAGYLKNFTIPYVSDAEQIKLGEAQALYTHSDGADYPYRIVLFFEESGHAVMVFGCKDLTEDEVFKVCENITFKEAPEKDPDHTYKAFSIEQFTQESGGKAEDKISAAEKEIPAHNIVNRGEDISLFESISPEAKEGSISVKDIQISDEVDSSLLSKDTTRDYDHVMSYIENGRLKPYERIVTEWTDGKFGEKSLGTVNVKNVCVTLEVKNTSDEDYDEVNIQPVWKKLKKTESGNYTENYDIPGYTAGDSFAGVDEYDIQYDGMAYYFDSSDFKQDPHFFNMKLKAGETKEVHLWFAIPEDELEDSYLIFENSDRTSLQAVKVLQ